jgi:GPH family glycoside/pentoside/hexuronide:cation symporter
MLQPQHGKAKRLPFSISAMYSAGNMSSQFLQWAFVTYLVYYYSPPDKNGQLLPIGITTAVVAIGRFLDGFIEPLTGYWSDRIDTRWGRRIPFLLFAGFPMCLLFTLLWFPPFAPNTTGMIVWLIAISTLFWFCITLVFCPYLALLTEIAHTSSERIFLSQLMQVFLFVATGFIMYMPTLFEPIRENPQMFVIIGALALVSIYTTAFGVPEKKLTKKREPEEAYSLIEALKWTFTNKAFLVYVISSLFLLLGFQTVLNGMIYIVTVMLGRPESELILFFGIILISTVISFLIIQKLSAKYTKKFTYSLCILLLGLTLPLAYFLGWDSIFGLSTYHVACVVFFFLGFPVAGTVSLGLPIIADIADYDATITGRRREAIFYGAQGMLQKYTIALTYVIQGFLFSRYGYSSDNFLGIQLLGPVTGAFVLIGFVIFLFYPLNERTLKLDPVGFAKVRMKK